MARAKRNDDRLLSKDEQTLVAQTRHPLIKTLSDRDLSNVVMRLREHRDRARDIGRFKRGELRSQSMKTSMIGVERVVPESDGHRAKRSILVAAVKRANKEAERRRIKNARGELISDAEHARSMRKAARIEAQLLSTRTAHGGVQPPPSNDLAPSGAWKQEGHRPVLERSRKVR